MKMMRLVGLQSDPALNGQIVEVGKFYTGRGRFLVISKDGRARAMLPENLEDPMKERRCEGPEPARKLPTWVMLPGVQRVIIGLRNDTQLNGVPCVISRYEKAAKGHEARYLVTYGHDRQAYVHPKNLCAATQIERRHTNDIKSHGGHKMRERSPIVRRKFIS